MNHCIAVAEKQKAARKRQYHGKKADGEWQGNSRRIETETIRNKHYRKKANRTFEYADMQQGKETGN